MGAIFLLLLPFLLVREGFGRGLDDFMLQGDGSELKFFLDRGGESNRTLDVARGEFRFFGDTFTWNQHKEEGVAMLSISDFDLPNSPFIQCRLTEGNYTEGQWMKFSWLIDSFNVRCDVKDEKSPNQVRYIVDNPIPPRKAGSRWIIRLHSGRVAACIGDLQLPCRNCSVSCQSPNTYQMGLVADGATCGCPLLPHLTTPTTTTTTNSPSTEETEEVSERTKRQSTATTSKQPILFERSTDTTRNLVHLLSTLRSNGTTSSLPDEASSSSRITAKPVQPLADEGITTTVGETTVETSPPLETTVTETTTTTQAPITTTTTTTPETTTTTASTITTTTTATTAATTTTTVPTTSTTTTSSTVTTTTATSSTSTSTTTVSTPPLTLPPRSTTTIFVPPTPNVTLTTTTTGPSTTTTTMDPRDCGNGLFCVHGLCDAEECACEKDWFGGNCNIQGICQFKPCQNGGVCAEKEADSAAVSQKARNSTYDCECTGGWGGPNCTSGVLSAGEIAAIVLCVLILVLIIIAGVFLFRFVRRSRKLKGKYNPAKEEMASGGGPPMPLQDINREERLI